MESDWPEDVAEIYRELAEEDRRLAAIMFTTVIETWPTDEEDDRCPPPS
ncbi:MAG TPA: hypothetical protein VKA46_33390 [Gemmataceae bacterium]|nr:hypothetical protein [Gemmataceae bacterium]